MNEIQSGYPKQTYYTEEQKAEKRKEIAERLKNEAIAKGQNPPMFINYSDELESYDIDRIPKMERSPEADAFMLGDGNAKVCASIKPKDVQQGLTTLTGILIAFKGLADAGFDVWDTFSSKFHFNSKEEEQMMKAYLTPNPEGVKKINTAA